MKVFLLTTMLVLGAASPLLAFTNSAPFSSPPSAYPQIDSSNFVNLSTFSITAISQSPFTFSDVQYFTNRSTLACDYGFVFENDPSNNSSNRPSSVFGNASTGIVQGGIGASVDNAYPNPLGNRVGDQPLISIWATNVVNAGLVDIGAPGVMLITGNNLNLARGTLQVEGFTDYSTTASSSNSPDIGIFDEEFGIGLQTNVLRPSTFDPSAGNITAQITSPAALVRDLTGNTNYISLQLQVAEGFAWTNTVGPSNRTVEAVLVNTNLPGITVNVRRRGGGDGIGFGTPYIQWQAIITNNNGLPTITNSIYLSDQFGSFQTNYLTNTTVTISGIPNLYPYNFQFTRTDPGFTNFFTNNAIPYDAQNLFGNAFGTNAPPPVETNAYAAYVVSVQPVSFAPDPTVASATTETNLPGRIELVAATSLDLTLAKISGPNYLNISSTNHFVGATNAVIVAPSMDLNVGSTNGSLSISNVIYPYVPRFSGGIELYACRWTNVDVNGTTNTYHVLIAEAALTPTAPAVIFNLGLRSTNITIGDVLNVESNALVNGTSLTITTNSASSPSPSGQVNLLYTGADWSTAFPNLKYLTNFGSIDVNSGTFYDLSPSNGPYISFVNHGVITTGSTTIWANYAENSSPTPGGVIINDTNGTFTLMASNALLYNGDISTSQDVSISSGILTISNQTIAVSGALTFAITNSLFDGGLATTNFFQAGDGLNLLTKPVMGDFLDSVITLTAPAGQIVYNTWAGTNVGAIPSGFHNNAAVGHLILDGGDANSQYYFSGPDTNTYAMYVDLLDLRDGATNRVNSGGTETFNAFAFGATNFIIYFADAMIGSNDISEKLNGANGGQLIWVPAYAGRFSSTNLVYPAGVTNSFNRALVLSTTIDSDADGTVNAFDLTPIYTANSVNFSIGITNLPPHAPVLHWNLLGYGASNLVYFKTNLLSTNWTLLTNVMTSGYTVPNYSLVDRVHTNGGVYYKLQVDAVQP